MTPTRRRHIHGPVRPMQPTLWQQVREVIRAGGGVAGLAIGAGLTGSVVLAAVFAIISFTGA